MSTLFLIEGAKASDVRVFSASSMQNALLDVSSLYGKTSETEIKHAFASSSVLARQIINGAPAHIFISANTQWMDEAVKEEAIVADSQKIITSNALVLVEEASRGGLVNPAVILSKAFPILEVLSNGKVSIGNPAHVPAGIYAKQAMESLGFWNDVHEHTIQMPNVRSALTMVDRGEAQLGIVYMSDTKLLNSIRVLGTFPEDAHNKIVYPAGIVRGYDTVEAREFLDFLMTDDAQSIFLHHGFKKP